MTPSLAKSSAAAAIVRDAVAVLIDKAIAALLPELTSLSTSCFTGLLILADIVINTITVRIYKLRAYALLARLDLFAAILTLALRFLLCQEGCGADRDGYKKENEFHCCAPEKGRAVLDRPSHPLLGLLPTLACDSSRCCAINAGTIA
jgi:hypothetical protein